MSKLTPDRGLCKLWCKAPQHPFVMLGMGAGRSPPPLSQGQVALPNTSTRLIVGRDQPTPSFEKNLALAVDQKSSIRLTVSRTEKPALIHAGGDASKANNEFFVRDEMAGEVAEFDGTNYILRFRMLTPRLRAKK